MSSAVQQLLAAIEETGGVAPGRIGNSGPKTISGKQRVALNGVTHGLTGQNVFLEESEYPAYMDMGRQYIAELRPVGMRETQLAQKIIDLNWRLNTVSVIENNLFHSSRLGNVRDNDPNEDRVVSMVTKADVWRKDCAGPESFVKLGRYEAHLSRTMTRETAELERLQAARLRRERHDSFDRDTCPAWTWYQQMYNLYAGLAAARLAEAKAEAEAQAPPPPETAGPPSPAETIPVTSTTSAGKLLRKNPSASVEQDAKSAAQLPRPKPRIAKSAA